MPGRSVSEVLRRAVLLHVFLAAPALIACGGTGKAGGACSVVSPPYGAQGGTCLSGIAYDFDGTASECGGNDVDADTIGNIPLSTCEALCPPVSDAGAFADRAGFPLQYCLIVTGCLNPPCTTMELDCEYGIPNCSATGS
jgi:hypothetical protein